MLYFLNDYNIAESSIQDEEQLSEPHDGRFDENVLFCIKYYGILKKPLIHISPKFSVHLLIRL